MATSATISTIINAPIDKVWDYYTKPEHIMHWNNASEDWHTPKAENDLREGGKFLSRMESKDGTEGFDFTGVYTKVVDNSFIEYVMDDGRKVSVVMNAEDVNTEIQVQFDLETQNSEELQRQGWQAILDSFKKYVETN